MDFFDVGYGNAPFPYQLKHEIISPAMTNCLVKIPKRSSADRQTILKHYLGLADGEGVPLDSITRPGEYDAVVVPQLLEDAPFEWANFA